MMGITDTHIALMAGVVAIIPIIARRMMCIKMDVLL